MERTLITLEITEAEAMLLSYGLRHPGHLLEGCVNNPEVFATTKKLSAQIDRALSTPFRAPFDSNGYYLDPGEMPDAYAHF